MDILVQMRFITRNAFECLTLAKKAITATNILYTVTYDKYQLIYIPDNNGDYLINSFVDST